MKELLEVLGEHDEPLGMYELNEARIIARHVNARLAALEDGLARLLRVTDEYLRNSGQTDLLVELVLLVEGGDGTNDLPISEKNAH